MGDLDTIVFISLLVLRLLLLFVYRNWKIKNCIILLCNICSRQSRQERAPSHAKPRHQRQHRAFIQGHLNTKHTFNIVLHMTPRVLTTIHVTKADVPFAQTHTHKIK